VVFAYENGLVKPGGPDSVSDPAIRA